jgi:hypothetical protein
MKTMFLLFLDRGRVAVPNFDAGRLAWRWFAGHWIPTVVPSFETHTTRPNLLHFGQFAWSPTLTMFLSPPFFWCLRNFFPQASFLTWRCFAWLICVFYGFSLSMLVTYTFSFAFDCLFEKVQLLEGFSPNDKRNSSSRSVLPHI